MNVIDYGDDNIITNGEPLESKAYNVTFKGANSTIAN